MRGLDAAGGIEVGTAPLSTAGHRSREGGFVCFQPDLKKAIRTTLAVVIAYAIALHIGWEKPYWAAWTAFSIGLATRGEGIQKGLMRLAGGLAGAVGGFVLLAFFIQDRWLFIAFLSLYAGIFTYLALGSAHSNYFWQWAGCKVQQRYSRAAR